LVRGKAFENAFEILTAKVTVVPLVFRKERKKERKKERRKEGKKEGKKNGRS
jgi:hypothetical protein